MERTWLSWVPGEPWVNVALWLVTAASCVAVGAYLGGPAVPAGALEKGRLGWPYAAALMAILSAHEAGHWVLARRHGVPTSPPYFLPMPLGFGTLGAFIRLRGALPSRRAVLDVGVAGPLAGFAVALPLLFWGMAHSTLIDAPPGWSPGGAWQGLIPSLFQQAPQAAPASDYAAFGDSLLTWAAQRLVWGDLPAGKDLLLHPVAFAAWFGLLVTAFNLIPLGQLDGGHLAYALLGPARAERLSRWVSGALLACGLFVSSGWLVWWGLTRFLVGMRHPPALEEQPLDRPRAAVALLGFVILVLTFVPVPMSL